MRTVITGTLLTFGLLVGSSTLSLAAQSIPSASPLNTASHIEKARETYYYHNHHRYQHREWDKRHRRWHYY